MTDRVRCTNPECLNTILPSTAERTHGLCMPCVQAAAGKERDEYVRRNRRDVNEFDGITDPVESLKIIHKPRSYDPLVNWIPHPIPTDRLYSDLSHDEQERLAAYAETLIGSERHDEAESIVLCLSAFTNAFIESCLRALVAHGSFWPSLPFRRASSDLRDQLIDRVERDEENRNHILLALAWIGDAAVVELFKRWRNHPPSWRESLCCPPQDYSHGAGWELSDDGQRRDLYFQKCTRLLRGHSASPELFQAITDSKGSCPWCGQGLTNLVDLVASEFVTGMANDVGRIQVTTCEVCTAFGTVFGVFNEAGNGRWSSANSRPEYLPDSSENWGRLPRNPLTPAGRRAAAFAADQFLPTTFSQVGELPTWIQDSSYPPCPVCSKTMMFLAQVDHGDIEDCSEGIYYAFLCPVCRTTATSYQQT